MRMRIKRFALIITLLAMFMTPAYSADDDSTPYMPYPEQPKNETPKPAPKKKAPVKKPAPKKKTPAKKPAPKKTSAKKTAPARPSSLQQAISLINQARYKEAKPYLLNAINANKNDPNVWYWYGVWHEKLGCFHEAQYFYTKALKIDPSFDPLSRVAYYPDDPDKIPLWDPKRPARVYPIETGDKNFTRVPPFARDSSSFPDAPQDPVIPKVPVYTPPERGSTPLDGDAWTPSVYVPPSPNDPYVREGTNPVYVPPEGPLEAEHRETVEIDIARRETNERENANYDRDRIIRADLPLYTPPAPGQKVTPPPAPKVTEQPKKKSSASSQPKQPQVPRRVVRQQKNTSTKAQPKLQTVRQNTSTNANRNSQSQRRSTQSRTASSDVRPSQPQRQNQTQNQRRNQTQNQTQRQPQRQQEVQRVQPQITREPEVQQRPQRQQRQQEFLPPVGQYAPDPGTISEAPIPPVGQGNQD
ncbi:MAG: tetratricopeptide repeat protein [Synergistaceae bacterium]|nr:tetratricopeptide repeat protein [Synergistaceae bacterium]MBQ3448788.1 tetratricopeptide repeat protein [Synergistaceae bacterium]MBR0250685.1 tetratricopeptide repeat protein [Synergistaceae bacterium]